VNHGLTHAGANTSTRGDGGLPQRQSRRRARRPAAGLLLALAILLPAASAAQPAPDQQHGRLFPPTDLGLLETPDRAVWQKPEQIMDALKIAEGARVADIGAGSGYFTIRLGRRVGPNGVVYAQDVQPEMLEAIKRRIGREGLQNVETVLGDQDANDPRLPLAALDAVLMVDTYQEVNEPDRVPYLQALAATLKPNGRIGIVNYKPGGGGPGPDRRIPGEIVEAEALAAGLRVLDRANLPFQYLLVLGK
jgi:SAM-dependent methyltransferase